MRIPVREIQVGDVIAYASNNYTPSTVVRVTRTGFRFVVMVDVHATRPHRVRATMNDAGSVILMDRP